MSKLKNVVKAMLSMMLLDIMQEARCILKQKRLLNKSKRKANRLVKSKSNKEIIRLEIGSGPKKGENGWITLDQRTECDLYWDLLKPLPFPENSIDFIYSSHVLEHFSYRELVFLLDSCHQTLKIGGNFSVCVPDASIYIQGYACTQDFEAAQYCKYTPAFNHLSKIDLVNYIAYMDGHHKYMFDKENLVGILKQAGFRNVKLRKFNSDIDSLERDYESIYAEAEK